ncbi:MAG: hypothetical protein JXA90_13945, partial [Planctomycetes bacterium]|nr:hypothetical protein [Planctomycetota bacterium]
MIWYVFSMCLILPASALGQPREVKPALNEVREGVPAGERPYEMVWAGREEARPPLVDFEDLEGWTVELHGKAVATLERSREQRMWGETSGKLTYRGEPGENRIVLRPPRPIPIPGRFTAANIWCFGNNWGWVPRADTPQVDLALHLVDSGGANHRISLGRVRWEEWWLVHRRVINHAGAEPRFPFALAAIEVSGGHQKDDRAIFLDSLSFYEEEWPALEFAPRPKRGVEPFEGQDQGLNTGPGKLPFPTREETILPANFEREFRVEARKPEALGWELRYEGSDSTVVYSVFPRPGDLGSIRVSIDGRPVARALAGAGVRLDGEDAPPSQRSIGMVDGVLRVEEVRNAGPQQQVTVELRYRLWQKSLVIDVICRGGRATELDLGAFEDVESPEAIPIPFANYGGQSHVLLARAGGKPFFGSVWVDWYRSSGSELFTRREVRRDSARINGGVRYRPKTDGSRNDLYERIFLTVSPLFEETLPTIANPPSRWAHVAGERLWQESWGPGSFEREHERSRRLRAYGIEKLIQCNHEIAWRDNADSFTLR